MSDNPNVTDKYPLLVIPGYIDTVQGEPLTLGLFLLPSWSSLHLLDVFLVLIALLIYHIGQPDVAKRSFLEQ
jgi:hypothetical protein